MPSVKCYPYNFCVFFPSIFFELSVLFPGLSVSLPEKEGLSSDKGSVKDQTFFLSFWYVLVSHQTFQDNLKKLFEK